MNNHETRIKAFITADEEQARYTAPVLAASFGYRVASLLRPIESRSFDVHPARESESIYLYARAAARWGLVALKSRA